MLNKLLKYDLEDIYKVLNVFYILSILSSVLTRIFFNIDNSTIANIIALICSGITISMIANVLINNFMRVLVRFNKNLYKDESYLTHTLPIKKKTIYLSKFLSSIITMITSIIVIVITLFIAYYSKENMVILKNTVLPIADLYNSSIIGLISIIILLIGLELLTFLQCGYTGLILGNKKNSNKMLYSIIYGIVTYFITQAIVLSVIFIFGIIDKDIMTLFTSSTITNIELFKKLIYLAIVTYTVCIIGNYFINTKLFEKGVNVD